MTRTKLGTASPTSADALRAHQVEADAQANRWFIAEIRRAICAGTYGVRAPRITDAAPRTHAREYVTCKG